MATMIRPELSVKNKYWIAKHRYYELKHFCLQYLDWKKLYLELDGYTRRISDESIVSRSNIPSDLTYKFVEKKLTYYDHMKLLEQIAKDTDLELACYILKGVTEELSYTALKAKFNIPCSKDTYYDRYRRFFWLLDKTRN